MALDSLYVTRVAGYAEVTPPDKFQVTRVAGYVELAKAAGIRTTRAAAYVELLSTFESGVTTVYAHAYSPYGIMASLEYVGGDDNHIGFIWQWSADGSTGWTTFSTTLKSVQYARHHPLDPATTYYYRAFPYSYSTGDVSNVASATTLTEQLPAAGVALWIDVHDSSNNKLGPGPLTEAIRWRNVRRLSRAGEFTVEFPATYLRLHEIQADGNALLSSDRYLYCYGILYDEIRLIGAGWVKSIELRQAAGSPPTIAVSGPDLLGELRKVTVFDTDRPYQYSIEDSASAPEDLVTTFAVTPNLPDDWDIDGGGATDTNVTAKFVHSSLLSALIDVGTKIGEFFRLGEDNNGREIEWLGPPADFAGSGIRAELHAEPLAAEANPDICLITNISEIADSWDLYSKVFVFGAGQGHDRLDLASATHWPDGERFRLDVSLISANGTTVTVTTVQEHGLQVGDEVELVDTNYDGTFTVDSIVNTTRFTYLDTTTAIHADGYVYKSLTHTLDGDDYVFNRLQTSLENTDARTAYGYNHTAIQFKEISPISNSDADVSAAANALLAAAYHWLRERSAPAKFYRLSVAKLDALLLPGQLIRTVARGFIDGSAYIDIDTDLTILESSTEIGGGGVRTTDLVVSTVDRWPSSDGEQAAQEFHQATIFQSQAQLGPSTDTVSYASPIDDDVTVNLHFWLGEEVVGINEVKLRIRADALRSTVKSISGTSSTTSAGGGTTTTTAGGGGTSTTTAAGGGATPTTTSYAPVTNHAHALEVTDSSPTGAALYYDTVVGLNANLGTGNDTGGSTNLANLPLTHDHDVTLSDHDHSLTLSDHTHGLTLSDHTHSVTPSISSAYGVYESGTTPYSFGSSEYEIRINSNTWRDDYSAISGASGWYEIDLTSEVAGLALRPKQAANLIEIRVKSAAQTGGHAQLTAQLLMRTVVQSVAVV